MLQWYSRSVTKWAFFTACLAASQVSFGQSSAWFQQERQIIRIEGDRIFLNAPISHSIDSRLSSGSIQRYEQTRIFNVGIQGIRGTTVFNDSETDVVNGRFQFVDEDHAENFIEFREAFDCFATQVTGEHLSGGTVLAGTLSRSITVQDARYEMPVSRITGGRRYAFISNGQYILQRDLQTTDARRAFINNSTFGGFNRGPNVFYNGDANGSFVRSSLQDGLFNVLVTDDRPVDWAQLTLNVANVSSLPDPPVSVLVGDVNLDGSVNFLDIGPFITLLTSGEYQDQADTDRNGVVNFLDIGRLIEILSGN